MQEETMAQLYKSKGKLLIDTRNLKEMTHPAIFSYQRPHSHSYHPPTRGNAVHKLTVDSC